MKEYIKTLRSMRVKNRYFTQKLFFSKADDGRCYAKVKSTEVITCL